MARKALKTSRPVPAFMLGLLATALVLVGHVVDLDKRAELQVLDLRFQHFSRVPFPDNILHVDIDDSSLTALGRWPWPRERLAGIIDVLQECGARAIVMDVILPEPQKVRYVSAVDEIYGGDRSAVIHDAPPVPVFDDAILTRAVEKSANVFLPMHIKVGRYEKPELQVRFEREFSRTPDADFETVLSGLEEGTLGERDTAAKTYLLCRGIKSLERFSIPGRGVKGYPVRSGRIVPPLVAFARAARRSGFVTFEPDDDKVLRRIPLLLGSGGRIYPQFALALAADELARRHGRPATITANGSFVTIRCADGAQRAIPVDSDGFLLINWARGTWPPVTDRHAGVRHIPATRVAAVLLERAKLRRHKDLAHVFRVKFLQMGQALPNKELEALYYESLDLRKEHDQSHRKRVSAERKMQRALLYEPSMVPNLPPLAVVRQNEEKIETKALRLEESLVAELRKPENLDVFLGKPSKPLSGPSAGGDVKTGKESVVEQWQKYRQEMDRFRRAKAQVQKTLDLLDALPGKNREIEKNLARLTIEVRALVAGKICMIGSTATGAADFVPTPLDARTPGVVIHSNIANTILSGSFIRQAYPAVSILVIVAVGVVVSFLVATRPVLQAGLVTVLLIGAYAAFNALVVFATWNVWLVVVAPVAAMLGGFAMATAYRQLTEERAKRQIRDMFAHAMSPALVDRLLEDPSLAELGGQTRTLSCMFSDLAGFTQLSESMGPQETVRLLNRYFDGVTQVVQNQRGGYLNKFLGDGIFAFFGAPVFQNDHPTRAIQAAVDCQLEVGRLNETLTQELGQGVRLSVRIGITTGEAMVGNCGSTYRMDYTAIGDCVNLASRLESANKFFGTAILTTSHAWGLCDDDGLLARPLGRVFVVGIREPVEVWEVLGRRDGTEIVQQSALADFTRAVQLFREHDFAGASELLEKAQEVLGDDRPTQIYLELCRECASHPPEEGWRPECPTGDGIVQIAGSWHIERHTSKG